ncbi:MAG TPA: 2TM domain-containing protein [Candidatus Caenarcaniphilales bacterium]
MADRMNFAVHVALFAATNSGLWFFRLLQAEAWPWTLWLTGGWIAILLTHGVYIFGVADYSESTKLPVTNSDIKLKS